MEPSQPKSALNLSSPAFTDGTVIPDQYSSTKGQNLSPQLNISGAPAGTLSFVLMMHDPDAISGDFLHWLMWDIPPSTAGIATGSVPVGAVQGKNGIGKSEYLGPAPPAGTGIHHYIFELYALDTLLNLATDSTREQVESAMSGHILEQAALTGLFSADQTGA